MSTDAGVRTTASERRRVEPLRLDSRLLVGAEMALAAVLGLIALGRRSFWLDESVSVTIARLHWSSFTDIVRTREGNMSVYHLLLFGLTRLLGDSELAARSLSVLAAVAAVGSLYLLARRLAGAKAGLLAAGLLAVNPMLVHYAQEARGYALCLLLVTLSSCLFARGLERPTWTVWIVYALVSGLAVYAHFFALLVPAGHATSLLFAPRRSAPWQRISAAVAVFGLSLSLLVYLLASNQSSGIEWAAGNAPGRLFSRIEARPALAAALFVLGVLLLLLLYWLLRRVLGSRLRSTASWRWAFALCWLLVPPALVVALALVYRPLFVVRYFIVCLPAVVLLLGLALSRIRARSLVIGAAGLVVLVSLALDARWYRSGQSESWRDATQYVVDEAHPGDGVLFYAPYVRIPFALYLGRAGSSRPLPAPVYPAKPWGVSEIQFDRYVPVTATLVAERAVRSKRVWLVLSHAGLYGRADPGYEAARRGLLEAGFHPLRARRLPGIGVLLFGRL
ncbi:MAG: glycosyltransferase family 39 protein [Gaiellaceae bacterium]